MKKNFVNFFQGYSLKTWTSICSFEPKFFFSFQNHQFQAFLVSKTYVYIFIQEKNNSHKSPLTTRGVGEVMALASAENVIFLGANAPLPPLGPASWEAQYIRVCMYVNTSNY